MRRYKQFEAYLESFFFSFRMWMYFRYKYASSVFPSLNEEKKTIEMMKLRKEIGKIIINQIKISPPLMANPSGTFPFLRKRIVRVSSHNCASTTGVVLWALANEIIFEHEFSFWSLLWSAPESGWRTSCNLLQDLYHTNGSIFRKLVQTARWTTRTKHGGDGGWCTKQPVACKLNDLCRF